MSVKKTVRWVGPVLYLFGVLTLLVLLGVRVIQLHKEALDTMDRKLQGTDQR